MADSDNVASHPAAKDDPFDLGDTSYDFAPKPEAQTPETPETTERPRNPDGTFAKVEPPPPPTSKHPQYLVKQALEFGFAPEEIEELSTNALGKTVNQIFRQQHQARAEASRQQTLDAHTVKQPEPAQPEGHEEENFDLGLDEGDYDPKLVAAMKKIAGTSSKRIKELEAQLAQRDMSDKQRQQRRAEAMFDAAFAALGEGYEKLFGKGTGRELASDKAKEAELARRVSVLNRAKIDPTELSISEVKAAIKTASEFLYGPILTQPSQADEPYAGVKTNGKAKPRITQEEWEEAGLARPTQRKVEEPKGEAKAVANLTKKMRDSGQETIPDSEEIEGFLG